jgi:hypothetical protein
MMAHRMIGSWKAYRPRDGDPGAYLDRRIAEEQGQYDDPILRPSVGQRYDVTGYYEPGLSFRFRATLRWIGDAEAEGGLTYGWDNGVDIDGDPVFMPDQTFIADGEHGWWIETPRDERER